VDRWERYGTDVADRLAALVSETPGVPHILYGHSLGGLIALDAVVREVVRPDVLVLSAPALGDAIAPWRRTLAPILDRLVPTMSVPNGIPGSGLSRDPAVAAGVAADPLNLTRSTVRLGAAAFAAQDDLRARLRSRHRLGIPTYVLHGSADPIVPVAATEPLARFPDVTRVVHPGLLHEPHHEPETDLVIDAILDWVRRTIGVHSAQLKTASGERERAESVAGPQTRGT
jgi:alpha-beta hydrolase superfamily lysophospholipase